MAAERPNFTPELPGLMGRVPFIPGLLTRFVVGQRVAPKRQSIPKTPRDHGMAFDDVNLTASDGLRLSAWLIPADDAKGVVIVNHPLLCTRYGSTDGMDGVPVAFLPMLRHLHDGGYTVLTYDQRGQGESEGGLGKTMRGREAPVGAGSVEWQDFLGALRFVSERPELSDLPIGFLTHCMGANAAIAAWRASPDAFDLDRVRCHVAVQPTLSWNMMARLTQLKLGFNLADSVEAAQRSRHGFGFADALAGVSSVKVPMLFVQVREDAYTLDPGTRVNDVQVIYDHCPTDKTLIWVGPNETPAFGTGKRFDGYNYFSEHPGELLGFLDTWMSG